MRIGATTFIYYMGTLEEFLYQVKEMGFTCVEVKCEKPVAYPRDVNPERRRKIRQLLEKLELEALVHASFYDVNLSSLNPLMREAAERQLEECIEFARDIGAGIVVFHAGNLPGDYPKTYLKVAVSNFLSSIKKALGKAEETGITLALENKPRSSNHELVWYPEDHLKLLRMVNSPFLKACVDVGHANTLKIDLVRYIQLLAGYTVNIHLHDNRGRKDDHMPIGDGEINFSAVLNALKDVGYAGPVILEVKSVDGLRKSMERLKLLAKTVA